MIKHVLGIANTAAYSLPPGKCKAPEGLKKKNHQNSKKKRKRERERETNIMKKKRGVGAGSHSSIPVSTTHHKAPGP